MWVIKRPIKDLESKPWPRYDTQALLSDETRNVIIYVSHGKIGDKPVEYQTSSLDDICEPNLNDLNPMIYLRLSRPLRPDTNLQPIGIE
jgi:hypothetical protein